MSPAQVTLVPTPSVARRLGAQGFGHVQVWGRGVDTQQFRPLESDEFAGLKRPVMLNAGRVTIKKNLEAFLSLDLEGTRVVVGDGPQLAELKLRYPDVVFTGYLTGDDLAGALSAADVFVFPSKTDTLGLVMLEALACGVPVAAFPVEGPVDVITSSGLAPPTDRQEYYEWLGEKHKTEAMIADLAPDENKLLAVANDWHQHIGQSRTRTFLAQGGDRVDRGQDGYGGQDSRLCSSNISCCIHV